MVDPEEAPDWILEPGTPAMGGLEGLPDGALEWELRLEAVGVGWCG
jgi:hypothetical protein